MELPCQWEKYSWVTGDEVGNTKKSIELMIYDGCWYNFNEGETNLQRSSCHNVVRGRNQTVHTAVTINFRSCLLDQIDVFNILFNVSFRR